MEAIHNSIKCTQCKDLFESPVILPCGDSVCKKHVQSDLKEYHCVVCDVFHPIPNQGFFQNKALESLLKASIQKAKFCPQYESAFDSYKNFEKVFNDLYLLQKDPFYLVNKVINELMMEVDILREEYKLKIDEKANEIIGELKIYEQECLINLNSNHAASRSKKMDSNVKIMTEQLDKWKKTLSSFDSNEAEWNEIKASIDKEMLKLEAKLVEYKENFLFQKLHKYELSVASFTQIRLQSDRELKIPRFDKGMRKLDSKIILDREMEAQLFGLCRFSANHSWRLLYRATSENEFSARNFHAKCDNIPNTLTLIKSSMGNVFGGYTQATWESIDAFKGDKDAFVFSLINEENEPIKMKINANQQNLAIMLSPKSGPIFGFNDIRISDDCNLNKESISHLGWSYQHPRYKSSSKESCFFLAGSSPFQVADIEIFQIF